jgi:hypothetical protein
MPKKKIKDDPVAQQEEFKRVAREAGGDTDKGDDVVMGRLARQKRDRQHRTTAPKERKD